MEITSSIEFLAPLDGDCAACLLRRGPPDGEVAQALCSLTKVLFTNKTAEKRKTRQDFTLLPVALSLCLSVPRGCPPSSPQRGASNKTTITRITTHRKKR
ncbi:hypothetical protein E2C01_019433 [Portunus trituberculatus]|uniref:Uncharacterized protein n=1 Tax=Portunus trituberculatus TaxID=210409 RepID=A0A5B7DYZ1_PORTR|nr:hypothetical protein [Portunus trituberculatus]